MMVTFLVRHKRDEAVDTLLDILLFSRALIPMIVGRPISGNLIYGSGLLLPAQPAINSNNRATFLPATNIFIYSRSSSVSIDTRREIEIVR